MAKINSYNQNGTPTGALIQTNDANTTPPRGFLYCDGSAISRTTYSKLFQLLGTRFGVGDGSTTFNIPDLRGMFLRGFDPTGLRTANTSARKNLLTNAVVGNVVGSYQEDDNKSHQHTYQRAYANQQGGYSARNYLYYHAVYSTSQVGGNENRPKNVAVNCFISYL